MNCNYCDNRCFCCKFNHCFISSKEFNDNCFICDNKDMDKFRIDDKIKYCPKDGHKIEN